MPEREQEIAAPIVETASANALSRAEFTEQTSAVGRGGECVAVAVDHQVFVPAAPGQSAGRIRTDQGGQR